MQIKSYRDDDNRRTTIECQIDDLEVLSERTGGEMWDAIHEIGVRIADELWKTLRPAVHEAVRKHFEEKS